MLETIASKQNETNWMLIGICVSVGVLLGGGIFCVMITVLIIMIIRKGTSYKIKYVLA
jgi:hypothetical protein